MAKAVRPLIRTLGERKKSIDAWIKSGTRVEKTLASLLPLALIVKLEKTCSRLCASTVTRIGTTQGTILSSEKLYQKTSIGFGKLHSDH